MDRTSKTEYSSLNAWLKQTEVSLSHSSENASGGLRQSSSQSFGL